jgi:hypothetical protein
MVFRTELVHVPGLNVLQCCWTSVAVKDVTRCATFATVQTSRLVSVLNVFPITRIAFTTGVVWTASAVCLPCNVVGLTAVYIQFS